MKKKILIIIAVLLVGVLTYSIIIGKEKIKKKMDPQIRGNKDTEEIEDLKEEIVDLAKGETNNSIKEENREEKKKEDSEADNKGDKNRNPKIQEDKSHNPIGNNIKTEKTSATGDKASGPTGLTPKVSPKKEEIIDENKDITIYRLTISALTRDKKPFKKTYESENPDKKIVYYRYDYGENKEINFYEVTVNIRGQELSIKLIEKGESYVDLPDENEKQDKKKEDTEQKQGGKTTYRLKINGYTIDGKPDSRYFTSSDLNETTTYYDLVIDQNKKEGQVYKVEVNALGQEFSRTPVKVDYTYKTTTRPGDNIAYKRIEELDGNLPKKEEIIKRKGVPYVTEIVETEKYLFGKYVGKTIEKRVISELVDEIVIVGTLFPPGNSGVYQNSEAEMIRWADAQLDDPNSKWYDYNTWVGFRMNHDGTKWSVTFLK